MPRFIMRLVFWFAELIFDVSGTELCSLESELPKAAHFTTQNQIFDLWLARLPPNSSAVKIDCVWVRCNARGTPMMLHPDLEVQVE